MIRLLACLVAVGTVAAHPALTPAEIAARVGPGVVSIEATTDAGQSFGSGFIVEPFGTVVTSLHVVDGAIRITVKVASGLVYDHVAVRAREPRTDLAILQLPGFGLPTVVLGDSESPRPGDAVVVLGYPRGGDGAVSPGKVRRLRVTETGLRVIETDARADRGSSGGPLVAADGRVVGVMSFKVKGARKSNLAVPIHHVRRLLSSASAP